MPIPYTWICSATIPANTAAYSEIAATCVEDPARGSENAIQRLYKILINTVIPSDTTISIDYVVRIKKEGADGVVRPVADSIPATILKSLVSVSGQLPSAFMVGGERASILVRPMEKVSVWVVNLAASGASETTVNFRIIAEKG